MRTSVPSDLPRKPHATFLAGIEAVCRSASMPGITRSNDAYGHELWACLTEGRGDEIVERDDGFIAASDAARLANGDEGDTRRDRLAARQDFSGAMVRSMSR